MKFEIVILSVAKFQFKPCNYFMWYHIIYSFDQMFTFYTGKNVWTLGTLKTLIKILQHKKQFSVKR